ncbi:TIGR04255 family protein [Pseudomonas sp. B21-017]|uniref:TIGR04255 family protein n=1 Tax=unclassified Pseudomonas TaxID=196821 RepID=UPI0012F827DD|nr:MULTISPECIES: TIGR04255 family protein [unclassified Pseudomonas]UVM39109.1 TIGR04255 family protein [Pseudomonas sp. B21-017]
MTKSVNQPIPSYKKPPINEVVCGCQFEQLKDLKITHFGDLWSRLKKDFPKVEHALPITNAEGFPPEDPETSLPLPRAWFINNTDSRLIQFQSDRFYYNWRKKERELTYPRYAEVFSCFDRYFKTLNSFVAENGLGILKPTVWELTYTNHIPFDDASNSTIELFKDIRWVRDVNRFLSEPTNPVWAATFDMPNDSGVLIAKFGSGRIQGEETKVRILELAARGPVSETGMKEWFDLAREWIVRGFTDLTTEDAHVLWEREI